VFVSYVVIGQTNYFGIVITTLLSRDIFVTKAFFLSQLHSLSFHNDMIIFAFYCHLLSLVERSLRLPSVPSEEVHTRSHS